MTFLGAWRKFHLPNGTVHSGCTGPTQTTARVIVLASRIQKSGTGDNNFVKWKGKFQSNRPKWPDRSKRTTFKADPEHSSWTKPKWSVPFDVATEIIAILGWMESSLCSTKQASFFLLLNSSSNFAIVHCIDSGEPSVNFRKIHVRKTIWDLEFSELICCYISCLPACPRIFEPSKNGIIAHFKRIFTVKMSPRIFGNLFSGWNFKFEKVSFDP